MKSVCQAAASDFKVNCLRRETLGSIFLADKTSRVSYLKYRGNRSCFIFGGVRGGEFRVGESERFQRITTVLDQGGRDDMQDTSGQKFRNPRLVIPKMTLC